MAIAMKTWKLTCEEALNLKRLHELAGGGENEYVDIWKKGRKKADPELFLIPNCDGSV